jgi:hypothetical protein
LPKSTSFDQKPGWTSNSYNFLSNVEEETRTCWLVGERDETPGLAVNSLSPPETAEIKDLPGM